MRTVKQAIPESTQNIRKRAYRDYTMERITRKQLDRILDSVKTLRKIAEEIKADTK